MLDKFIEHLEAHVGKAIYVWGAQGQQATDALIEKRETSSRNKRRARALLEKRIAAGIPQSEIKAFDCSGLGVFFLLAHGLISRDTTANGLRRMCERVDRNALRKGDFVFKYNGARATHIGYVADDSLNVIESKGRDDGVIKRHVDDGSWNRFGRPPKAWWEVQEDDMMINGSSSIAEIKAWQEKLESAGFQGDMNAKYYGQWGAKTEKATKAFQKANGLAATGAADSATQLKMAAVLAGGDDSALKQQIASLENTVEGLRNQTASLAAAKNAEEERAEWAEDKLREIFKIAYPIGQHTTLE